MKIWIETDGKPEHGFGVEIPSDASDDAVRNIFASAADALNKYRRGANRLRGDMPATFHPPAVKVSV